MKGIFLIVTFLLFSKFLTLPYLFSQDFSGEICFNQLDDDQDGWVDCDDLDCQEAPDCRSKDTFLIIAENCINRIDDDNNGLVDCQDPVCINDFSCQNASIPLPPPSEENYSSQPPEIKKTETPSVLIYIPGKRK